jgi:acetolactate synthase-1/3 small subunit
MIKRKLILIMENKPGALVRVVGLFHQRGYNIETLHVDSVKDLSTYKDIEKKLETKFEDNQISRLTIETMVSDDLMRQILRQLNKLIDVIAVSNEETTYLKGVLLDENLL